MIENELSANEPPLALLVLIFGFILIGVTWHFVLREWIPIRYRLDMFHLLHEHWQYWDNFSAYLAWQWPSLMTVHYPYYFMAAVFPSTLWHCEKVKGEGSYAC